MEREPITPSSLIVPLFGEDPPDETHIMRRLTDIFPEWGREKPDTKLIQEAGLDGELEWLICARIPGLPETVLIWPEELEDLAEDAWWAATDVPDEERDAFEECLWGVVIETRLSGGDARQLYRTQVKAALAISDDATLIYDDTSLRILTRERAESLVELPSPPSAQELYSLHAIYDEQDETRYWMHTHGLDRAGVPDIELFNVPAALRSTASQLIALVAERLLDGLLDIGDTEQISPDLKIKLIELDDALDLLPVNELGGYDERDDLHISLRVVLATFSRRDGDGFSFFAPEVSTLRMDGFLSRLEKDEIVLQTRAEVNRRQDLARFRWAQFLSLWRRRDEGGWTFMICIPVNTADPDLPVEHLWFEVLRMEATHLVARLINAPLACDDLEMGDIRQVSADEVCDWSIATPEGVFTPANIVQLARRNGISILSPKPVH
jgi:uncharacterized protein YegJ (DUF2314 family)